MQDPSVTLPINPPTAVEVVGEFWRLMASNDFESVAAVLADDYVLDWPQSNERIRGKDRFAAVNSGYPANGKWVFTVHRIFGNANEVVSEVSVTDGVQNAKAISFFTLVDGKITRQVEYWPEPYAPAANRKHLVEAIHSKLSLPHGHTTS
jgi:ketosteroid isomerase-like protein